MNHLQPDGNRIGKGNGRDVSALAFDHQTNGIAAGQVEYALLNQMTIHCGIKIRVVHDVVDMTIGVVVVPTGFDVRKLFVI